MTTPAKLLGIATIAAAGIVGGLWLHSSARTLPARPPASANGAAVEPPAVTPPVASERPRDASPSANPGEAATFATLPEKMSDRLKERVGNDFVDYLVSKGLSHADSERIVAAGVREMAQCQLDATVAQADAQSIPRDAVLEAIEAQTALPAGLDLDAIVERVAPCMSAVRLKMGVPAGRPGQRSSKEALQ